MQLLKKKYAKQLDEQATEYIDYAVDGANRIKKADPGSAGVFKGQQQQGRVYPN
jgi:hypothetical protein